MARLFVGLALPDQVRRDIWTAFKDSREAISKAKWVPHENLHITLKFLGEVPPERLTEIRAALDITAQASQTFSFSLEGTGAFPSLRKARILWAGVCGPPPEMMELHRRLEAELCGAGFPPEPKRFHPHVTTARLRVPQDVSDVVCRVPSALFEQSEVPAPEVVLFESRLSSDGAKYSRVASFDLRAESA